MICASLALASPAERDPDARPIVPARRSGPLPTAWRVIIAVAVLLVAGAAVLIADELGLLVFSDPFTRIADDQAVTVGFAGTFPAEGEDALAGPLGIVIQGKRVYVAESGAGRIAIFTVNGKRTGSVVLTPAAGALRAVPTSLATAGWRRIAVLDAAADRVLVLRTSARSGSVLFRVGEADPATAPVRPTSVTFDDGTLYVADAATATIKRYDRTGRYIDEIGATTDPALGYIGGMAMIDGMLVIAESESDRVTRLDPDTGARTEVCPGEQALPRGIAPAGDGVAITEVLNGTVYLCDPDGARARTIDDAAVAPGVIGSPEDAAWNARTSRLYVTDPDQGRVVVINVRM